MKKLFTAAAVLAATTTIASAGGLERSGQSIGVLFEEGRHAELSFGFAKPKVTGTDVAAGTTGNVGNDYVMPRFAYKADLNDQWSYALIFENSFGADIQYAPSSTVLGGTMADAIAHSLTGVANYRLGNGMSFHGGLRLQAISADVALSGVGYGAPPPAGLNGYTAELGTDYGVGYVVGAAYEKPEIALRVAFTYNSAIDHSLPTTELGMASPDTDITSPESWNLEFQSGVAADTLVFGSVRWVNWSQLVVAPAAFAAGTPPGASLTSVPDYTTYTLGVGRRFNDSWSGAISVSYEEADDGRTAPLDPKDGQASIALGATYSHDDLEISGGISHTWLGDVNVSTAAPVATFSDNTVTGFGIKIAKKF